MKMKNIQAITRCFSKLTFTVRPNVKFKYAESKQETVFQEKQIQKTAKNICSNNSDQSVRITKSRSTNEGGFVSADLMNLPKPKSQLDYKSKSKDFEILYGIYPILLSLQAQKRTFYNFYFKKDVLEKHEIVKQIYSLCESQNIPTHCVPKAYLRSLVNVDSVHQGVCLEASCLPFAKFDHLQIKNFNVDIASVVKKLWLYLDQINDPMNLGAILRSSYFLGVENVFSSKINSCPVTSVVSKASAGVAEVYPIYQVADEENFLLSLKKSSKWQIISSTTSQLKPLDVNTFQPTQNILLIVGNEGRGISKKLESLSDAFVNIPPHSNCNPWLESLNVSVATSILVHSLLSKLRFSKDA